MKPETMGVIFTIVSSVVGSTAFIVSRFTRVETKVDDHIASDEKTHARFEKSIDEHGKQIGDLQVAHRSRN